MNGFSCPSCRTAFRITATIACPPIPQTPSCPSGPVIDMVMIDRRELDELKEKAWKYEELCK